MNLCITNRPHIYFGEDFNRQAAKTAKNMDNHK